MLCIRSSVFLYYGEENLRLVPLMVQQLHELQAKAAEAHPGHNSRETVHMEGKNVISLSKKRGSSHPEESGNEKL